MVALSCFQFKIYINRAKNINWHNRIRNLKRKLNFQHHMLTSSTERQIWSFHVVVSLETLHKYVKMKKTRAALAGNEEIFVFFSLNLQVCDSLVLVGAVIVRAP